jgi:hypothetical protein
VNRFQFGRQTISTQVFMMMPVSSAAAPAPHVDVTAAMDDAPRMRAIRLTLVEDPFSEVEL